jgi:hypothetical protein
VCTDLQTVRQVGDLRRCGALRFSGSDRTREAVPSAAPVAAGRVTSWSRAGSLGRRSGLRDHGSALAVADRGCATTGLRRGGRGGEGSCGDGRPHEKGGVEAGTGEVAQPFASSGRNGSAVALGASAASSCRHCASGLGNRGGESIVELLLPASGGGGAPYLHVRDQFG